MEEVNLIRGELQRAIRYYETGRIEGASFYEALAALERLSARLEELEGKLDEASALPDMWMDGRDGARAQLPYEDWMPRYWTALGLWDCAAALCRALEMPEPDPLPEPTTPTPGPWSVGK